MRQASDGVHWPTWLPDGERIAFLEWARSGEQGRDQVDAVGGGRPHRSAAADRRSRGRRLGRGQDPPTTMTGAGSCGRPATGVRCGWSTGQPDWSSRCRAATSPPPGIPRPARIISWPSSCKNRGCTCSYLIYLRAPRRSLVSSSRSLTHPSPCRSAGCPKMAATYWASVRPVGPRPGSGNTVAATRLQEGGGPHRRFERTPRGSCSVW